jgi:hypothetical protein
MNNQAFASEQLICRREAQEEMAREMRLLIEEHNEEEGLKWTGSRLDLMEALYYLFETGTLYDEYGMPSTFIELVRRACRLLHTPQPANPYEVVRRGLNRKGIRQRNLLDRYCYMKEKQHENRPTLTSTYISYCKK